MKEDGFLSFVALLTETVQLVSALTQTQKGSWWGILSRLPPPPFFSLSERVPLGNPKWESSPGQGTTGWLPKCPWVPHGTWRSGISSYIFLCIFIRN